MARERNRDPNRPRTATGGTPNKPQRILACVDEDTKFAIRATAEALGLTDAAWLREVVAQALASQVPVFDRGWLEGYRNAISHAMTAMRTAFVAVRTQFDQGELTDVVDELLEE